MGGCTSPSTPIPTAHQTPPPQAAPLRWRSAEHLGGQALTPASYRHKPRTSRQRNPQPRRTLAALPSGAHDSDDAAPNTTHEADDNTNSKVERRWGRSPRGSVPSSRTHEGTRSVDSAVDTSRPRERTRADPCRTASGRLASIELRAAAISIPRSITATLLARHIWGLRGVSFLAVSSQHISAFAPQVEYVLLSLNAD